MMSMKVDWDKLRKVQEELSRLPSITDETEIVFVMIMADQSAKKAVVKFKDFLGFFWTISENAAYRVVTLVVQDKEGRILYRHRSLNAAGEEIPVGGNSQVLLQWNTLSREEKDTYLRLLEAQINGYPQ
jgi:hypothetical protein